MAKDKKQTTQVVETTNDNVVSEQAQTVTIVSPYETIKTAANNDRNLATSLLANGFDKIDSTITNIVESFTKLVLEFYATIIVAIHNQLVTGQSDFHIEHIGKPEGFPGNDATWSSFRQSVLAQSKHDSHFNAVGNGNMEN